MSLLQNEEFAIYQLRTAYLANIHDGIGERLIDINTGFLNDPAFRAAGWSANPAELKRTYSPPIPTAVTAEYFQAPPQSAGLKGFGLDDDDDEGGIVTGSNDTVGPALAARRRRRREQLEEEDSSDLSDESDDDTEASHRPVGQIKFAKMPVRNRSGSSPIKSASQREGPSVLVTSPSKPEGTRLRSGSLGAVEFVSTRSRRGTATSSEMSSENDPDPALFKRRQVRPNFKAAGTFADQIKEDKEPDEEALEMEGDDAGSDSDSSLASAFSEALDSNSLLEGVRGPLRSSPLGDMVEKRTESRSESPKKPKQISDGLQALPPPRPISMIQPVSALAMAIKARNKKPTSPFERFAVLSGNGDSTPLYIKIYVPSAANATKPLETLLRKHTNDGDPVTVAEAIGFSLWKYGEEGLQPPVSDIKLNVNSWTLRIVEDGEVDMDFPPLARNRPILDFTSNNNRPTRVRARDKPWDEFALVEANDAQFTENEDLTPLYSEEAAAAQEEAMGDSVHSLTQPSKQGPPTPRAVTVRQNPITDPMFITAGFRKDTMAADIPTGPISHATPQTGAPKTLNIHFTTHDLNSVVIRIDATTDTYIAEVFEKVCKRLNVDKALYVLKVTNTLTVAPSDRTVEALGAGRSSLDLVRRRFVGDGSFGLSGSPGSTSPNAPLLLTTSGTPKRNKRGGTGLHPLAQQADLVGLGLGVGGHAGATNYKRYNVIRKQPMSFTPSHQRVLVLDGEYMHIMPGETGKERLFDPVQGKITSVHFSSVVGCKVNRKHPKTFRVVVFRERESKRYDFEAGSAVEAAEIVQGIKKGIEPYRDLTAGYG